MFKSPKILGLILILLVAVIVSEYLTSLRSRTVTGIVGRRAELKSIPQADILSWLLPPGSTDIEYWIIPSARQFETSFQIELEPFELWIETVQGGEVAASDEQTLSVPPATTLYHLVPIPEPEGLDFRIHISKLASVHIDKGVWLKPITTSKFRLFSAAYDVQRKRAYVLFYL